MLSAIRERFPARVADGNVTAARDAYRIVRAEQQAEQQGEQQQEEPSHA